MFCQHAAVHVARPFTVVDGGLSSALEVAGHDLRHPLWTARLLADAPDAIVAAHLGYLRAGAEIVITSSYQASVEGFTAGGISRADALTLIGLSTELAREAVRRHEREAVDPGTARVAASVGPYGAVLADRSEYGGHYPLADEGLVAFHRSRLEVLIASDPDLLAVETIPTAAEARAIATAASGLPVIPAWVAFTCADEATTAGGDAIEDAVAAASAMPGLVAVGVNCTDPAHVAGLLRRIRQITDLPLVAYPNDGRQRERHGHGAAGQTATIAGDELIDRWIDAGAVLIGGCCGTAFDEIRALRNRRDELAPPPLPPVAA